MGSPTNVFPSSRRGLVPRVPLQRLETAIASTLDGLSCSTWINRGTSFVCSIRHGGTEGTTLWEQQFPHRSNNSEGPSTTRAKTVGTTPTPYHYYSYYRRLPCRETKKERNTWSGRWWINGCLLACCTKHYAYLEVASPLGVHRSQSLELWLYLQLPPIGLISSGSPYPQGTQRRVGSKEENYTQTTSEYVRGKKRPWRPQGGCRLILRRTKAPRVQTAISTRRPRPKSIEDIIATTSQASFGLKLPLLLLLLLPVLEARLTYTCVNCSSQLEGILVWD